MSRVGFIIAALLTACVPAAQVASSRSAGGSGASWSVWSATEAGAAPLVVRTSPGSPGSGQLVVGSGPRVATSGVVARSGVVVTGRPSATARPDDQALPLRVVSYNIRHGVGMDDRLDLERTAATLRRLQPDIVALQEVDEGVGRSGRVDQPARLGELLGMEHAFGSFMEYQGGRYGLAILSRHPIRSVTSVRLRDGNEPRVALAVVLELRESGGAASAGAADSPGEADSAGEADRANGAGPAWMAGANGAGPSLTVIDVHFDWVADDSFRFAQAQQVAAVLDTLTGHYLLMGDFNDQPGSRTLALFQERATEARKPAAARLTFSATDPEKEIDFIFVSPASRWEIGSVQVVPATLASDHRPVLAVLGLSPTVQSMRSQSPGADAAREQPDKGTDAAREQPDSWAHAARGAAQTVGGRWR